MTQTRLGGSGLQLPQLQALYPATIQSIAYAPGTNHLVLSAGQTQVIPAGDYIYTTGQYSFIQFFDPISTTWRGFRTTRNGQEYIHSDGVNFRIANLLGCPIGATVTTAGSSYVQSSTTVTVSSGNSTWYPIVGGRINPTVSITAAGAGYTIPPQVVISAPPAPGMPATGYATISSGSVSSIILTNYGAGYTSGTAQIFLIPSQFDPAYISGSITNATASLTVAGSGTITGVLCTNPGQAISSVPSLTISGAGSSAVASVSFLQTVTGVTTVTNAGNGYNAVNNLQFIGGQNPATPVSNAGNPSFENGILTPRQPTANFVLSANTLTNTLTILDGGMFTATPTFGVFTAGIISTVATFTITAGTATDTVTLMPI